MESSKRRIAIISYNRVDCACGGIEDHLFQLVKGLSLRNFTFHVYYAVNEDFEKSIEELSKYCIPIGVNLILPYGHPFRKIEFNLRVRKKISNQVYDVIQLNGDNGFIGNYSNVISVQYGATTLVKVLKYGERNVIKSLFHLILSIPSIFFEMYGMSVAQNIVLDNESPKQVIKSIFPTKKISIIYDLIDLQAFRNNLGSKMKPPKAETPNKEVYAIWVSTSPAKGLEDAMAAIEDTNSTTLLVVGFKPAKESKKVIYLGYLSHEKLAKYLKLSDYLILPSRKRAIDLVVIEAISCGIIPVLYRSAYSFLFNDNQAFLANDLKDLKKVVREIDLDPQILKNKNAESVLFKFLPEAILSQYSNLYEEI